MTDSPWDAAEDAVKAADQRLRDVLASLPDDMTHHAARNRIVGALGFVDDAAMFAMRARVLADAVDLPNTDKN